MNVAIIETGYVGLVSRSCFADMGHMATCLDIDKCKINQLNQGVIPIYEPGLEELVKTGQKSGRLNSIDSYQTAMKTSNICLICVPTPPGEDGSADLNDVLAAAKRIASEMNRYTLIVNKSTVPLGTAIRVAEVIKYRIKTGLTMECKCRL